MEAPVADKYLDYLQIADICNSNETNGNYV